jgi:hypothetical protein
LKRVVAGVGAALKLLFGAAAYKGYGSATMLADSSTQTVFFKDKCFPLMSSFMVSTDELRIKTHRKKFYVYIQGKKLEI